MGVIYPLALLTMLSFSNHILAIFGEIKINTILSLSMRPKITLQHGSIV